MAKWNILLLMWAGMLVGAEVGAYVGLPIEQHSSYQRFMAISMFTLVVIVAQLADKEFRDD
jgi:uncharacterized membrane protein YfcA